MSLTEILTIAGILLLLFFRKGVQSGIIAYVAAYFAYFSLGPVINLVLGQEIYDKTVLSEVNDASVAYLVVLGVWLIVDIVVPDSTDLQKDPYWRRDEGKRWTGYTLLLIALTLFGTFYAVRLAILSPFEKAVSVGTAAPFHYQYVLLESIALSMLFYIWPDRTARFWYSLNAISFIAYGLLGAERDFIFLAFSLFLHALAFGLFKAARWTPFVAAGFAVLATWIFSIRGNGEVSSAGVLNQGSVLFVDTVLLSRSPILDTDATESYWNMVSGGASPDFTSLSDWFVDFYLGAGAQTGYGYSMVGEARLNAGLVGVAAVFAALALFHQLMLAKASTWRPGLFFAPLFMTFLMYAMRGDLQMLVNSLVYGAVLLIFTHLTQGERPRPAEAPEPTPAQGATRFIEGLSSQELSQP